MVKRKARGGHCFSDPDPTSFNGYNLELFAAIPTSVSGYLGDMVLQLWSLSRLPLIGDIAKPC